jgi:tetratricopeptide (TPR) repeat protein
VGTPRDKVAQALQRGVQLHHQGRLAEAEAIYQTISPAHPRYFDALHLRGLIRHQQGRNDEAWQYIGAALKGIPNDAVAWANFGLVQAQRGEPEAALAGYDRALALKPDYVKALKNRGNILNSLGRPEAALASYDRMLALKPDDPEVFNNRGNALRDLGRPEAALASYDRALALRPDDAEACNNRGNALQDLGRPAEALASYDRALALKPAYAVALNNRGNALKRLGRAADALASYEGALALRPDYVAALNNRGNVLKDLGRLGEALASYERALALQPDYAAAYDNKGLLLTALGRFDEAGDAIKRAIELSPRKIRYYYNFSLVAGRLPAGNPHLRAMEDLAREMDSLTPTEQVELNFALSKVVGGIGDTERSFRYLLEGNAVKRQQVVYDEAGALNSIQRVAAAFTAEVIGRHAGQGETSPVPVFILGLPRSGTTLVEQILASHQGIYGAGEIDDFELAIAAQDDPARQVLDSPGVISTLSGEELRRLGAEYLGRIKACAPNADRITNKLPENFRLAGLIHLALPNARIIHTRRDPIDTCLSCFSQLFAGNLPYTYDLAELGRYYRAYDTLMSHWRKVLPPEVMIEVHYEELVADLAGQARRLVAHCGLDWDPRCLDFHQTERAVRTASMTQVRQPIYPGSVGRWRAYERFLGPLLEELG